MSKSTPILEVDELSFGYGPDVPVLDRMSFQVAGGSLTCILGPNGCGKTTLLRCLMNQLSPGSGRINLLDRPIEGYDVVELARLMAYVPQTPTTTFAFTAKEIVMMGRYPHTGLLGIIGNKDLAITHEAMKMTEVIELADRTLDELSGGEAQRVMIARALAQQPQAMLLDEPTSHLDIRHQLTIHRMMQRVAHDWPMSVVAVSHDVNMAARFADELVLVHEGKVLAAGSAESVVRKDLLEKAYNVEITLIDTGERLPVVQATGQLTR